MCGRQIIWENNGLTIDSVIVSADEPDIDIAVKKYLIEMLTNKPNPVLQVDWSKFGKTGDCIKIV